MITQWKENFLEKILITLVFQWPKFAQITMKIQDKGNYLKILFVWVH